MPFEDTMYDIVWVTVSQVRPGYWFSSSWFTDDDELNFIESGKSLETISDFCGDDEDEHLRTVQEPVYFFSFFSAPNGFMIELIDQCGIKTNFSDDIPAFVKIANRRKSSFTSPWRVDPDQLENPDNFMVEWNRYLRLMDRGDFGEIILYETKELSAMSNVQDIVFPVLYAYHGFTGWEGDHDYTLEMLGEVDLSGHNLLRLLVKEPGASIANTGPDLKLVKPSLELL
jgi:hypothetical protein